MRLKICCKMHRKLQGTTSIARTASLSRRHFCILHTCPAAIANQKNTIARHAKSLQRLQQAEPSHGLQPVQLHILRITQATAQQTSNEAQLAGATPSAAPATVGQLSSLSYMHLSQPTTNQIGTDNLPSLFANKISRSISSQARMHPLDLFIRNIQRGQTTYNLLHNL